MTIGITNQTKKPRVPWWNDKIKEAISNKNKALKNVKKNKTAEILIELKRLRAKSKFFIKINKKESFIKAQQSTITDQAVVADTIGIFFQENFSDKLYGEKCITEIKIPNETIQIKSSIEPDNLDQINLNLKITMDELKQTLRICNSKSPGPNTIPYSFLYNMATSTKQHLLNIYNHIWKKGQIPIEWKKANIIPILKPGKDKHSPEGYRPISLIARWLKFSKK
ncbi:hypothetical protein O181_100525 [Austropuccinia psidii MF-1]|uniref:Reverse transcriptase domain-containing protein n=1 Tax=Austropuccinia psidii MF-1 TaxID=1389203 RepID=A0A9Q3PGY4_9BASI|nr:hypothetical protein [Austropuccinia psidii MF-1]